MKKSFPKKEGSEKVLRLQVYIYVPTYIMRKAKKTQKRTLKKYFT